jgi:tetratricopeptide (TPR) repeat protein
MLPLCFVMMPSGTRSDPSGAVVDFDAVYRQLIAPAVRAAGLEPLRADRDAAGAPARARLSEGLMLCEFALADLTGAQPAAYYALGLRHGLHAAPAILLFAGGMPRDHDPAAAPALSYRVASDGTPADAATGGAALQRLLAAARAARDGAAPLSPVFRLVERAGQGEIARLKTDVFRERADYAPQVRERLARARESGRDALHRLAAELGRADELEAGVAIDLLLSYRALGDWPAMTEFVAQLAAPLARSVMVREQLGLALNRLKRHDEAERVLQELIAERGPSSETNALLGRVYKDRWLEARAAGDGAAARRFLARAIEAYLGGFEADWRDAFPGINAATLMELSDPPDPRRADILPLVAYAVERRLGAGGPDYWDWAAALEIAVLRGNAAGAADAGRRALAAVREDWEAESTARTLALIRTAREARGEHLAWAAEIEGALRARAGN